MIRLAENGFHLSVKINTNMVYSIFILEKLFEYKIILVSQEVQIFKWIYNFTLSTLNLQKSVRQTQNEIIQISFEEGTYIKGLNSFKLMSVNLIVYQLRVCSRAKQLFIGKYVYQQ